MARARCRAACPVAGRQIGFAPMMGQDRAAVMRHGLPLAPMFIWGDDTEYTLRLSREGPGYLVAASGGYGFRCRGEDLLSRGKAGKAFMTLEKGEKVLAPGKVFGDWVAAASENGLARAET